MGLPVYRLANASADTYQDAHLNTNRGVHLSTKRAPNLPSSLPAIVICPVSTAIVTEIYFEPSANSENPLSDQMPEPKNSFLRSILAHLLVKFCQSSKISVPDAIEGAYQPTGQTYGNLIQNIQI